MSFLRKQKSILPYRYPIPTFVRTSFSGMTDGKGLNIMSFWRNKKVVVTGGAGFIGSHLTERLVTAGAKVIVVDKSEKAIKTNLVNVKDKVKIIADIDLFKLDDCLKITKDIDIVMNLAAKVAGIEYNQKYPAEMFFDNVKLNANMLESARINKVERFLVVSSACVYPRFCTIPTPEREGMVLIPEPTNEGYGWAKRMEEAQGISYAKEFGIKIAIARPYNAYGPRDCFDPEKSHVIPALIKRVFDGENPVKVWGDGEQSRAFLYVEDFARGLMEVCEKYPEADPVNIGTDEEVKIKDLVKLIVKLSGKDFDIVFDTTKPTGQPRRNCDNTKAMEKVGYKAKFTLQKGLEKTIEWYKKIY